MVRGRTIFIIVGAVLLVPVLLLGALWLLWSASNVPSKVVDFRPTTFQAKAKTGFFYSVGNQLKFGDEISLAGGPGLATLVPPLLWGAPGLASETWESNAVRPPRSVILIAMTRGLVRYQQSGEFHFLTFSCYHRLPYLTTAAARNLFEAALEQVRRRYVLGVAGYVVMPEHVHLLVSEPRTAVLARAVQALKLSVTRRRTERPFWQARYYDFNVHSSRKVSEKLRYIHRNPVERGLVKNPEEWAWSSYRHYASGERGTVEIESMWTAAKRGYEFPLGFEVKQSIV